MSKVWEERNVKASECDAGVVPPKSWEYKVRDLRLGRALPSSVRKEGG